ncbi:MAG TPA: hypothetical protein VH227_01460 [Candidatus Udaeobacter sp.]|nr:hypothetical protein [Candidatus Udaeobacter sp.]
MRKPSTKQRKLCRLLGVLLILLNGCKAAPNRIFEESFERLYTVESNTNVTIENGDGSVLLYGSNVNEMRVHAVKKAYKRARLAQMAIDVSATPGSVSITTKFPPKPKWGLGDRSGTVDYTIVVPASASVSQLELNAGEILVDGMRGSAMRAQLNMGRMFARNCFSQNLDLAIQRGNLMVSFDWWQAEQLSTHMHISHGNAWAYLPIDAAFHLLVEAEHGKIVNDFNNAPVGPAATNGMKIDRVVNGGDHAVIEIRVGKGNINIAKANP